MKQSARKSVMILTALLGGVIIIAALELTNTTHLFHKSSSQNAPSSDINYGPPTNVEKQDSEAHKSTPINVGNTDNISTKKRVTVDITTWAQKSSSLDVNGFANGVVEEGGICTLALVYKSDSTQRVVQSRPAEANASNTTCGVISVPLSKLRAGTWNATLSYSSATATGTSEVTPLEVR
jgi:hypothetical protein